MRALAVNRNYKLDDPAKPAEQDLHRPDEGASGKIRGTYPNTTNPLLTGGGDITGYQAGSTFKIFTHGRGAGEGLPARPTRSTPSRSYQSKYIVEHGSPAACPGTNTTARRTPAPAWPASTTCGPASAVGQHLLRAAEEQVGADKVVDVAKRLGIQFRAARDDDDWANDKDAANQWGAFTLGVSATTPLELANAYATLAADGMYCEPIPVQEITDQDGNKLDVAKPRCKQACSPRSPGPRSTRPAARSATTSSHLAGAPARTARRRRAAIVGQPVAGKTGTTDEREDRHAGRR